MPKSKTPKRTKKKVVKVKAWAVLCDGKVVITHLNWDKALWEARDILICNSRCFDCDKHLIKVVRATLTYTTPNN